MDIKRFRRAFKSGQSAGESGNGVSLDQQQTNEGFDLGQVLDYVCEVFYRARRKLATGAVGVLALWLGFHVIFGANGMVVYQQKRSEYRKVQKELQEAEQENQRLTKQVESLRNDPKAVEREAREQLHYTKPGEKIYLLPEQTQQRPPASAELKK
jgi:cell division protein FtsB